MRSRFAIAYGEMFSKATLFPKALTILGATAEERGKNDASFERWQKGELSNFEYLLRVNRLAGRRWSAL